MNKNKLSLFTIKEKRGKKKYFIGELKVSQERYEREYNKELKKQSKNKR
jgi:hypothetical protein